MHQGFKPDIQGKVIQYQRQREQVVIPHRMQSCNFVSSHSPRLHPILFAYINIWMRAITHTGNERAVKEILLLFNHPRFRPNRCQKHSFKYTYAPITSIVQPHFMKMMQQPSLNCLTVHCTIIAYVDQPYKKLGAVKC